MCRSGSSKKVDLRSLVYRDARAVLRRSASLQQGSTLLLVLLVLLLFVLLVPPSPSSLLLLLWLQLLFAVRGSFLAS